MRVFDCVCVCVCGAGQSRSGCDLSDTWRFVFVSFVSFLLFFFFGGRGKFLSVFENPTHPHHHLV